MTDSDKTLFFDRVGALAAFYGMEIATTSIAIYWSVLVKYSLDDITKAMHAHLSDPDRGSFIPKPADFIRHMTPKLRPASLVWDEVLKAMEDHGAYESVCFTDSTINKVIRVMGGWPAMCRADIGEPWTQKEFERLYTDYQGYPLVEDGYLPGLCEADNGAKCLREWIKPPIMIGAGDRPKALPEGPASPDIRAMLFEAADATKLQ